MAIGDPTRWAERFRSLDVQFLECLVSVWPKCLAMLPKQPHEDTITINLVDLLRKDRQARRLFHWLAFQYEPIGHTPDGTAYSKGKIDMAVLLDQDHERYLAYECKRLNVVYNGKRNSLAGRYVTEGLIKFITEQYAERLPVGCMLGYVMDGNVSAARSTVYAAINRKRADIGLTNGPMKDQPIGRVGRFVSRHLRPADGQQIEIRHAFLPF